MAIDNLNYYSAWLPAWQQTDKYSSQPWCLRSKNLDIFSSSKSVKATAWSTPTTTDSDVIKQDGVLILKTDWKVYERGQNWDTLLIDPAVNFISRKVSYNGKEGTYVDAQRGTVKDMVVKYEWDERKSFIVFTDRASFTYSKTPFIPDKTFSNFSNMSYDTDSPTSNWYSFQKTQNSSAATSQFDIKLTGSNFATVPIRIRAVQADDTPADITLDSITYREWKYRYNPQDDAVESPMLRDVYDLPLPAWDIKDEGGVLLQLPTEPAHSQYGWIKLTFRYTPKEWYGDDARYWNDSYIYLELNKPEDSYRMPWYADWDYNYYYSYLPIDQNRHIVDTGEYYWMPTLSFQTLYHWDGTRSTVSNLNKKVRYDFVWYMGWNNDTAMTVVGMMAWNEAIYMIGNMDWNWYIIPCDLSWGRGTPFIAYWCTFYGVTNIDYLMYLVGDDRGVSQLWVYNWQELVPIIWGNETYNGGIDAVKTDEQYRFDGTILEYKGNLILTTDDSRIFQYGQTYGGKWGAFIHQIPWVITSIKAEWDHLNVEYDVTEGVSTVKYKITYMDAVPYKNYNTEWMAEYPIVIGNHILEKEESDLYASYILPSSQCSLEFWGMANHYHFWTFTSADTYEFSTTADYKMKWCTGNYTLKYIETNGNQYTFRLEGNLPVQTTNVMKITDTEGTELITYTEYNHFRKIWEITASGYTEWEFRFHNINNKLELPRSHSLQIMVKGKGTATHTPELFAVDLVANQRDRW